MRITKTRKDENTNGKDYAFATSLFLFVLSSFRVFVIRILARHQEMVTTSPGLRSKTVIKNMVRNQSLPALPLRVLW